MSSSSPCEPDEPSDVEDPPGLELSPDPCPESDDPPRWLLFELQLADEPSELSLDSELPPGLDEVEPLDDPTEPDDRPLSDAPP